MLHCPSCSASIPASDVEVEGLAKCRQCDRLFRFEPNVDLDDSQAPARPNGVFIDWREASPILGRPYRESADRPRTPVELSWRWRSWSVLLVVFCTLFWNAITWALVVVGVREGSGVKLLGISVHVIAGIAMGYFTLVQLFNRTQVVASEEGLSVDIGPLPWRGRVEVSLAEIEDRVRVEKGGVTVMDSSRYHVEATALDGGTVRLLSNLAHERARYAAWALNQSLAGRHPERAS